MINTLVLRPFVLLLLASASALALSDGPSGVADHDRARHALERGEVRPIGEILRVVSARVPGEVVGVEFEREHGGWRYELKLIAPDGRVLEVEVDAATGRILEVEED
ncbi:PepSY domain-containing protein [Marichromatium bheemlicum]|uniref:PepSY domain-containing protein n=1 Tax=Marichromatium bheemlicum TaxID=365339 RepID=A0ABX1IEV0_9GAMM|nr:PepSY domain-containing protein [Marichromatium bheemlicum]NKN34596.1 PepSY domain-containing protein [Marichromatium bheemlicum]